MKKIILFLVALVLFATAPSYVYGQTKSPRDLLGKWEGSDDQGNKGILEFTGTDKVVMYVAGQHIQPSLYKADFSKNPIPLDVIIFLGGENKVVKNLVQFTDNNTLKWQVFPDGNRPENFTNGPVPAIVLKRKK